MSIKRQTVWSILPLIAISLLNLVSVPLFYRSLGPDRYALWFYVLTFTGAFGFMDLGLGVAVGRYVGVALGRKDLEAVREYWGTGNAIAIPLLAAMGLFFSALGVIFGPKWFNVDPSLVNLLRWCFVGGGASLFLSYYGQFWLILSQAHLDFKFISILRTATNVLQIIPAIALAWATKNVFLLILWGVIVSIFQLGIFIWHSKKFYSLNFSFSHASLARAREMAAYTGKTFANLVVNSVLGSADRLVLGKLAPPGDFANYTICWNAGSRILGLSTAVMGPVFSNTNRAVGQGSRTSIAAVYNEIFDFTFPWYALISVWVCAWHPALLRVWLGQELGAKVGLTFAPVVIGCCLTAISNVSTAQLGSLNRVGIGLAFHIVAGALLVGGVAAGWRWYGLVGVAWAFLASRGVLVVQDIFVIRLIGAGGWLAGRTWKILVAQIVAGFLFFLVASIWSGSLAAQITTALFHGGLVAAWFMRHQAKQILFGMRSTVAPKVV